MQGTCSVCRETKTVSQTPDGKLACQDDYTIHNQLISEMKAAATSTFDEEPEPIVTKEERDMVLNRRFVDVPVEIEQRQTPEQQG